MTISTHTALGEIVKVDMMDKGYTKLVLLVNIPYKTQYLTFSLWNAKKFLGGDDNLKVGDCVFAQYHYNTHFTQLDNMTKMISFDNCPICWCNLEAIDAQRIECPECSNISEEESKEQVSDKMKLTCKELNEYRYSSGYKLKFVEENDQKRYTCVVFKNSPLFENIDQLKIAETYHVVGWKHKEDLKCHVFDIVNIFKI